MRKNAFRDYFSFTRGQQRGILALLLIIVALLLMPYWLPHPAARSASDFRAYRRAIAEFEKRKDDDTARVFSREDRTSVKAALFHFDPNSLADSGWQRLGVSPRVARTIRHYREAGGRFYKPEDLQKIYGLSPAMYKRLLPYVRLKNAEEARFAPKRENPPAVSGVQQEAVTGLQHYRYPKPADFALDINTADSADWVRLQGIGPARAAYILRFRERLGGFYRVSQVAEVYGLPDSVFRKIEHQLNISSVDLKKININTATVDEMKSHPYISYRLAATIKAFREEHGSFDSVEDLKQVALVDDRIYRKLAPYIVAR
ncbi:helix-hairpin-helix domain-containing protein [Compostibacter hankyongensis]|uniref:Helix-hairpin-helix domain-containing protein n=1 Tax=Compostibacter hankyongensis TaxID=1007089 RepID=A0ABP8FG95_9BACT